MMSYHKLIIIGILFIGCKNTSTNEKHNQALINELQKMANIDQIVADIPKGKYKELTKAQWKQFKDSVFKVNQKRAKEMLDTYGFIGYDLAGEKGSHHFWLIVQHSDHNPIFQKEVLNKMKKHVFQKNANPKNYAFLTDRVMLNTFKKQIYGTQVAYNWKVCQAYPENLEDSVNVNSRRKKIGLEPIEIYLNEMSKTHYQINKNLFLSIGIKKPKLYTVAQN